MTLPPEIVAAGDPSTQSLVLTATVSAVTAAVVALGIEWFAKPSLEARKERILDEYRANRRLLVIARDVAGRLERRLDMRDKNVTFPEYKEEVTSLLAVVRTPRLRGNKRAHTLITDTLTDLVSHPNELFDWQYLDIALCILQAPWWRVRRRRIYLSTLDRLDDRVAHGRQSREWIRISQAHRGEREAKNTEDDDTS